MRDLSFVKGCPLQSGDEVISICLSHVRTPGRLPCRHILGEILLNPAVANVAQSSTERQAGIAEAAFACGMYATEPGARKELLSSIVLCGGYAKIPYLHQRFMNELRGLCPTAMTIEMLKCVAVPAV